MITLHPMLQLSNKGLTDAAVRSACQDIEQAEQESKNYALYYVQTFEKPCLLGPFNWGYGSPDLPEDDY